MANLIAMTQAPQAYGVAAIGDNKMYSVNLQSGTVVPLELPSAAVAIKCGGRSMFCVALDNGQVAIIDSRTRGIVNTLSAHACTILSMDLAGTLLATCGVSRPGRNGNLPFAGTCNSRARCSKQPSYQLGFPLLSGQPNPC